MDKLKKRYIEQNEVKQNILLVIELEEEKSDRTIKTERKKSNAWRIAGKI